MTNRLAICFFKSCSNALWNAICPCLRSTPLTSFVINLLNFHFNYGDSMQLEISSRNTLTHPDSVAWCKHVDLVQPPLHELNPGARLLLGPCTFGSSPAPSTSQPAHFCTPHWHRLNRCLCGPMGVAHDLHPVSHWATCPC